MTPDWRAPPCRAEHLREQRGRGRSLCGVFPAVYPRELLWALDVLPVEIWDPPLDSSRAAAHLQPTICSVARLGLELLLRGDGEDLDALLFPHTCDTLQNLASVVHDTIGVGQPCYFLYPPRVAEGDATRAFYRVELQALADRLSRQFGPLRPERLAAAVDLGRQVAERTREAYRRRGRGHLPATATEFYRLLRSGEYLHPEAFVPLLDALLAEEPAPDPRPAVVLSGILPNPPQLLSLLDDLGVRVGHDDLLCCGRRLPVVAPGADDPLEALAGRLFALPPCSTRNAPLTDRAAHLCSLVADSGARGVIFNPVKFCETELFDIPPLTAHLREQGIPSLVLETEPNALPSGQLATRVEAFVEMLEAP